ncbi:MAG: divalent cation tolerance protein CutA [Candidatus Woesearchaeota archaeon]
MSEYCYVLIAMPSKNEADQISKKLIEKRLVAGSIIFRGDTRYWWKGEIVEEPYWNINAWSLIKKKEDIIKEVKKLHSDEVPVIAFFSLDGNNEFLEWIEKEVV